MDKDLLNIAGSALGGVAGSAASGLMNYFTSRSQQEYASELQYTNWKRMFDYASAYNSPANQLRRSAQVGINPFVSPSGATSVAFGRQDAAPSAAAPVAPGSPFDFGSSFSQVMQALLTSSQVKRAGIENSRLGEFLDAQIRHQISEAGLAEVNTAYQEMANEVYAQYGKMEQRAKLKNLFKDLAVKESQILLNSAEADYDYHKALEALASEAHLRAKAVLGQKEIDVFDARFQKWLEFTDSQITANRAGASRDTAVARTENELRSERKRELILENGLRAIAFESEDEFSRSERQVLLDRSIEEAEIASKENNLYYYKFAVDVLKAVAQGAMSATFGYKLLKTTKAAKASGKTAKAAKSKDDFEKVVNESAEFDNFYGGLSAKDKKIVDEFLGGSGVHSSNR